MESLSILLKGLLVGLVVAFPCGPVGLIYVKRAVTEGFLAGLITGLGLALADLLYAALLIFGYVEILSIFNNNKNALIIISSIVLIILGYFIFRSKKRKTPSVPVKNPKTLTGYFLSTFLITIGNPIIIIQLAFFFSLFGIFSIKSASEHLVTIAGLAIGSLTWPILTSLFLPKIGKKLPDHQLENFQKIIGLLIVFSGLVLVLKILIF